jgi:hypothetical protein
MSIVEPLDLPELREYIRARRAALAGFLEDADLVPDGDLLRVIPRKDIYVGYLNDNRVSIGELASELYGRKLRVEVSSLNGTEATTAAAGRGNAAESAAPPRASRSFNGTGAAADATTVADSSDDDDFDPTVVEPVSASRNGTNPSNSHHGLADEVRAAIRSNPQVAFEGVLGASLTRKPGSKEPVARCPFHDDTRPSLRVNLDKATYYCDPCAKGGDLFDLARGVWGLDFPACARRLVEILSVNGYRNSNRASQSPNSATSRKVVRRSKYEIRDLDGTLKATHKRFDFDDGTKDMPWDPVGIKPAELPLFQIEKTTDSMDGETVVLCEGEKAAAALWDRRQLAVGTVTGGDRNGRKVHCDISLQPLVGFDVVLWPDNDENGAAHMQVHGDALLRMGCKSVQRIEWREAPPKGDAADFTGDDAALQALIDSAQPIQPAVRDKNGTDLTIVYADRMSVDAFDAYQLMVGDHREYSWDGLIRDGCSAILSALIGAGKSTLAMNLARAWGLGIKFLGRRCRQSKTLVVVSAKEFEAWTDTIGFWGLKGLIFIVEAGKAHFVEREETVKWFDFLMQKDGCKDIRVRYLVRLLRHAAEFNGDSNRIAMNEQTPCLSWCGSGITRAWLQVMRQRARPRRSTRATLRKRSPVTRLGRRSIACG